jgi:hypothetical protein
MFLSNAFFYFVLAVKRLMREAEELSEATSQYYAQVRKPGLDLQVKASQRSMKFI